MGLITATTVYNTSPKTEMRKVVFYFASASAADTFDASSYFSSILCAFGFRTPATGTIVACTISTTTITIGSGPSSEAFVMEVWGVA